MKTRSRMRTLMADRTCLFVFFCLLAGCWNSHAKQEDGDQAAARQSRATASDDQPSAKIADSSSAEGSAGPGRVSSTDDELGFKHTWRPKSTPSVTSSAASGSKPPSDDVILPKSTPPAKSSAAASNLVAHPAAADDRYAETAPALAVSNHEKADRIPGDNPHSARHKPDPDVAPPQSDLPQPGPSKAAEPRAPVIPDLPNVTPPAISPTKAEPAKPERPASDVPPLRNPLRDPGGNTVFSRPEALPQPIAAAEPVKAMPEKPSAPTVLPPRPAQKSEVFIQIKPDEAGATKPDLPTSSTLPAPPAVAPVENKPEPPEHGLATAKPGPRTNKNSGVPFDPIKVNGPIFVDWPKPKLALVITGNQEGYLEPCGCAGLDRMKGGMSRRYSLFRELRQKGWPLVGIDVGNIAKGFGKQAEVKFQISINAMSEMGYSTATLGLTDLHLPAEEVMALTMPTGPANKTMFVCGNVGLFAFNETLLPRTQLITAGFKTIGITAVLGKTNSAQLAGNASLKIDPPEKLLAAAIPLLKSRQANYLILLAQTTRQEAKDLAGAFPDFDLVICADSGAEPPAQAEEIRKGGTKLIGVGEKGMYAVVLGFFDDPKQPLRYQRVTLDSRFPAAPEMTALMSAYQGQLKDLGLNGLGIRPLPHPLKPWNGDFVGTDACKNCHEESYRVWKKSPHSRAFATLQNLNPPRNFDPECISCHTVGWHPTKFFPYQSGYLNEKETPHLINVGCEDCHGPGQLHVRVENHGTPAEQIAARKTLVITKEEAANPNSPKQNCWSCHDLDNSPEFKFDLYWPFVKHYERE